MSGSGVAAATRSRCWRCASQRTPTAGSTPTIRSSGTASWTFAAVDTPLIPAAERDRIVKHLRWHGFVALGRGLLASPSVTLQGLQELLPLVEPAAVVPTGCAQLADLDRLVDEGFFAAAFRTAETESAYWDFLSRYEPWHGCDIQGSAPLDAYALRTMLVHDFRRIRLRAPDIPSQLLPPNWIGDRAYERAADLYHRLSPQAAEALGEGLEVDYPLQMPRRFGQHGRRDALSMPVLADGRAKADS